MQKEVGTIEREQALGLSIHLKFLEPQLYVRHSPGDAAVSTGSLAGGEKKGS